MLTAPVRIVTNGDMSGNVTSLSQQATNMYLAGIQAVWTGSPVGTIKLQMSNDNITYTDYTGSAVSVSGAGDFYWNCGNVSYPYFRCVYTRASGSGTLNVTVNIKGV